MKRVICVLLLILLCACSGEKDVVPHTKGISFTAAIQHYNEQYECDVTIDADGNAQITVNSPEDIGGLKFVCTKDGVTAEYLGLSYTPNLDTMPSGGVAKCLYEILQDTASGKTAAEKDDGNYAFRGKVGERSYTLMLAPTGLPISAEIPDESYSIDFKNVTIQ